jgi:hypothetical protein
MPVTETLYSRYLARQNNLKGKGAVMIRRRRSEVVVVLIGILCACGANGPDAVTPEEAQATAREAYVWGFPMVMNFKTLYNYVIDTSNPEYKGPFNEVSCVARLFTPQDKAVVTPNADTPYCMFWLDLRAEPQVLSVPEMEPERFYHFQLVDLYTHNFAYVGTLTTGNGAGSFLIAGPDWHGDTPEGIEKVLSSETEMVFVVTRTQLFGSDDLERVKEIQAVYELQPLSSFVGIEPPPAPPMPGFPVWQEGAQFDERFFASLDFMMTLLEEPAPGREDLWQRLARLGIGAGDFDFAVLPSETQEAMKAGREAGFADIETFVAEHSADPLISGKLLGTRRFLEQSAAANFQSDDIDILRSVAAHMGLYGNSAAEAIYPTFLADADGNPLDGSTHSYTMTFAESQQPPVQAFWSVTMYDGTTQLFIDNPIDRYLLNSTMMDDFRFNDDGSLTLLVQRDSPGADMDSNWLPAPDGPFYLVMRLYGPEAEALEGTWTPPPVVPVE